tara:strand:- start:636 stop:1139 length:504 start_codon:yes stop_codon:yes gene_type:complete
MKCEYCELRKSEILYEDSEVAVIIKDTAVTPGQITVLPKEHFTILEMVPNKIMEKCFLIANKVSIAIFESLGAQGTNLVMQNGLSAGQKVPHFSIEIIPRREEDGLNLQWTPQQLMEDELEALFAQLKDAKISLEEKNEINLDDGQTEAVLEDDKDNYLLKSIRRIP